MSEGVIEAEPVDEELGRLAVLRETMLAIQDIHKAFGAPGDYGYNTEKGKALYRLYRTSCDLAKYCED